MGDSASGHIGFGFKFEKDDYEYPEAVQAVVGWNVESVYTEKKGLVSPPFDDKCRGPVWDKWREEREKLWKEANVVIEKGGFGQDDGQTDYYLLVRESHIAIDWEKEEVFDPEQLKEKPHWRQQLKDFCEFMEVPYSEPRHMAFVYYG